MGKLQKHQKKVKAEKSKVKLRVKGEKTKFLPKGLNVTDTSFKIKPITLPSQLQFKSNEEPLSKRKLNTKELIQRLKHHNINVRTESGDELCLIINGYPEEILNKYLSQLLQSSCQLILDKERKVRKICIKLLETILKHVSEIKVEPIFGVISSFLRCSMTNIDVNIQEDSLMLLDVLLKQVPTLVAKDSEKLLSNFLTLISTIRADSKPGRTLTVNLGSKLTSVKWKIKVLHRLRGILQAVVDFQASTGNEKNDIIRYEKVDDSNRCFPLHKKIKHSQVTRVEDNVDKESIVKQIRSLISLLYESWLEVAPEVRKHAEKQEFTNINADSAATLNCILNILNLLNVYVEQLEMRSGAQHLKREVTKGEYVKFVKTLLQHFPYAQNVQQQSKNSVEKILDVQTDPKCLQENLLIAYILCQNRHFAKSDEIEKIMSYINFCLKNRNYVPSEKVPRLIAVLQIILSANNVRMNDLQQHLEELLLNVINFYNSPYISNANKMDVLFVLADVNNAALNQSTHFQAWLGALPSLLCAREIHIKTVGKLSLISARGNDVFRDSFSQTLKQILENVLIASIVGIGDKSDAATTTTEELARTKILNMVTHLRKLRQEQLDAIKNFIQNNKNNGPYSEYMQFNFPQCT